MLKVIFKDDWYDPTGTLVRASQPRNPSNARNVPDEFEKLLPSTTVIVERVKGEAAAPVPRKKLHGGDVVNPGAAIIASATARVAELQAKAVNKEVGSSNGDIQKAATETGNGTPVTVLPTGDPGEEGLPLKTTEQLLAERKAKASRDTKAPKQAKKGGK